MAASRGLWHELTKALRWHRRLLAAGLAAASVAVALHVVAPGPPPTVAVWVAARDLPGGSRIGRDDLRLVRMDPDVVPDGTPGSAHPPVGRVVAAPMRAGEPVTDARLLGRSLLAAYVAAAHAGGPGSSSDPGSPPVVEALVAAPVRLSDPGMVALLRAGDRIDVLAASTAADSAEPAARAVARDVPVVTVPRPGGAEASGLAEGALVVVAVPPQTAAALARAAVTSRLSAVLRP